MEVFVSTLDDFKSGTRHLIKAGQRNVAVYHHRGKFYAIDNACYHHGGPLLQGDIEELGGHPCVVCPWHSYRIALDTGEGLYWGISLSEGKPQQELKTKGCKQRCHKVYVKEGKVFCLVDDSGPKVESDNYATMPIANSEAPTRSATTAGGPSSLHSGLRSGHVFSRGPSSVPGPVGGSSDHASPSDPLSPLLLRCAKVIRRCEGVSTFVFEKLEGTFGKRLDAGQWVTLGLPCGPGGAVEARTYTVTGLRNSEGGWFSITVKLSPTSRGGSKWLHESTMEVLASSRIRLLDCGGTFTIAKERSRINSRKGRLLMLSAGIGVTPMYASLNQFLNDPFTLSAGPPLHILHIHIDKSEQHVPFLEAFRQWHAQLSNNKVDVDPVTYQFTPFYTQAGGRGRPDAEAIKELITTHLQRFDVAVMVCGPQTFMASVIPTLVGFGVPSNNIVKEAFDSFDNDEGG